MFDLPVSVQEGWKNIRKEYVFARPFITSSMHVKKSDLSVRLWVARRKLPFLMAGAPFSVRHQAILVPVGPDLKMSFGIAKRVRDYGADRIQVEADKVAPLQPGEAFIGSGARYRYEFTVLAVIFDQYKRTSPELITRAVRYGTELANRRGCNSIILPDMTENLLAQPNWITQEQRRQTAELAAITLLAAVRASKGLVNNFNIWCWDPDNADIYRRELQRL